MDQRTLLLRALGLAFLFGLAFWLIDSMAEFYYFGQNLRRMMFEPSQSLFEAFLFNMPPRTIFVRLSFMITCLIGGFFSARFIIAQHKVEQRYQNYVDNAPLGIFVTDDQGRRIQANPAACKMTGYGQDELLDMSFYEIFENPSKMAFVFQEIKQKGQGALETVVLHKDGARFHLFLDAIVLPDGHLMAFGQDITDRIQADKALQESEEQYRLLAENTLDVIWTMDMELRFTYVNPAILTLTGHTPDEWIGTRLPDHCDKTNFALMATVIQDEIARGLDHNGVIFKAEMLRKDNSPVPVEIHGRVIVDEVGAPVLLQGVTRDITERKLTESARQAALEQANQARRALLGVLEDQKMTGAALRKSEEKYRLLAETTRDLIILHDMQGRITYVNQAGLDFGGFDAVEAIGKPISAFVTLERQAEIARRRTQRAAGDDAVFRYETEFVNHTGQHIPVEVNSTPILQEEQVEQILIVARDITERKQNEKALKAYSERLEEMVARRTRELEDAQERLLRHARLATLGQVAGGIAHELRTPLGAIKNAAYLINLLLEPSYPRMRESMDPALCEALDIMNLEVHTADRIITSLLNFARPQLPARQLIDMEQVVSQALQRAQPPPEVQTELHIDSTLSPVIADAGLLEQVFGNLILNAIQAMPGGGRLSIRLEQRALLPAIEPPGFIHNGFDEEPAGWIVVSIADTGPGIAPENLSHIFEPLFTTKVKGMGLGLALVKMLAQANNGCIAVASVPGQGATFETYWPVAAPQKWIRPA